MWYRQKERNADWFWVGIAEGKIQFERILKRLFKKEAGKTLTGLTLRRLMSYIYIWSTHS